MYSNLKNVQYLVAMLKANKVFNVVVSPGNSHNAIVRSMEEDDDFHTYSVVDERSAGFFACGLAQELKRPVALCCTAGTAATNYMTGVTEAFRRQLPIIVITGDKNPYYLGQYEDQMIEQMSIFDSITRYNCRLPIIETKKDELYCWRILNEAYLELDHHGCGPVHIDVPIENGMLAISKDFTTESLPSFKKIQRHVLWEDSEDWESVFGELLGKRVMLMCGQDDHIPMREVELIEKIFNKYNCFFATDKLSNLHCEGTLEITRAARKLTAKVDEFIPDVLISFGGNPAMDYKFQLKTKGDKFVHWIVNKEGRVADPFRNLEKVFEGTTLEFLERMARYGVNSDHSYLKKWKVMDEKFVVPEFEYSNLYVPKQLMERIPSGSNLNLGNSTTIRIAQYFNLDESVQVYCNRGVNGIDGCVSTFVGQAIASQDVLNFLVVGDLTFFYDMNAIWNRYVGKNVRIMLNNNEGAALFHFNQGTKNFPTLNENVAAEHYATAKGWVESQGFVYLCAHNKAEYDVALERFMSLDSDAPIFFEVFTKKEYDAQLQHEMYDMNLEVDAKYMAKQVAKKILRR